MGPYIANEVMRLMVCKGINPVGARVWLLGLAFKENCPDLRNTRVVDVVEEFRSYHANVEVHDPWVSADEARHEYGLELVSELVPGRYDAVILAVAHRQFTALGAAGIRALGRPGCVVFDVKHALARGEADDRL
jgi:UDP-N-acetyl-D-galactosamine dehydrogenase